MLNNFRFLLRRISFDIVDPLKKIFKGSTISNKTTPNIKLVECYKQLNYLKAAKNSSGGLWWGTNVFIKFSHFLFSKVGENRIKKLV